MSLKKVDKQANGYVYGQGLVVEHASHSKSQNLAICIQQSEKSTPTLLY